MERGLRFGVSGSKGGGGGGGAKCGLGERIGLTILSTESQYLPHSGSFLSDWLLGHQLCASTCQFIWSTDR